MEHRRIPVWPTGHGRLTLSFLLYILMFVLYTWNIVEVTSDLGNCLSFPLLTFLRRFKLQQEGCVTCDTCGSLSSVCLLHPSLSPKRALTCASF